MLSMPHMIVVFIVVLVVFGPHKLPELARGLGKIMAEFRKASTDFKSAFEQEMRDIERQALQAERKKAAEAAATASAAAQPATLATPAGSETTAAQPAAQLDAQTGATEATLTVKPVPEAVPRSNGEPAPAVHEDVAEDNSIGGLAGAGTNGTPENEETTAAANANGSSSPPANGSSSGNGTSSEAALTELAQIPSHDQQRPA